MQSTPGNEAGRIVLRNRHLLAEEVQLQSCVDSTRSIRWGRHSAAFDDQHITLHTGDLIFTSTPAKSDAIQSGDALEVELEGVGVLRNAVVQEQ